MVLISKVSTPPPPPKNVFFRVAGPQRLHVLRSATPARPGGRHAKVVAERLVESVSTIIASCNE